MYRGGSEAESAAYPTTGPCLSCPQVINAPITRPTLHPLFQPARVSAFVSATIMTPQLDAAQHILIKALLKEGFETKLIASQDSRAFPEEN